VASPGFDLFIIGAGSAGVRAARVAGQRGMRVAVAEDAALGGTCVNVGCIPKKLYSFAAHYADSFEESRGFGWSHAAPSFDWSVLEGEPGEGDLAPEPRLRRADDERGATILRGRARLVGPRAVEVNGVVHAAERIVVATGGWPVPPAVPGAELAISSNEIFDLPLFPQRLVVHRRRLHRQRVRLDLQRPRCRGDPALSRRADPARLRPRGARLRRRRDE
jgi:glutathione reductase (NADPH)